MDVFDIVPEQEHDERADRAHVQHGRTKAAEVRDEEGVGVGGASQDDAGDDDQGSEDEALKGDEDLGTPRERLRPREGLHLPPPTQRLRECHTADCGRRNMCSAFVSLGGRRPLHPRSRRKRRLGCRKRRRRARLRRRWEARPRGALGRQAWGRPRRRAVDLVQAISEPALLLHDWRPRLNTEALRRRARSARRRRRAQHGFDLIEAHVPIAIGVGLVEHGGKHALVDTAPGVLLDCLAHLHPRHLSVSVHIKLCKGALERLIITRTER